MNYLSISGIVVFLTSLISSLVVGFSIPRNIIKSTWSLFSFAISLWGFGIFIAYSIDDYNIALWCLRLANLFAITIPLFFMHFVFLFIDEIRKKFIELIACYSVVFILLVIAVIKPNLFIPSVVPKMGFAFYPNPGPLYIIYTFLFIFWSIYGLFKLFIFSKSRKDSKGSQAKYISLGVFIGFIGGSTTFFPVFNIPIYPFGASFLIFYVILVSYAIVKYRFMDIRLAITQAGIFLTVYALVLGFPFAIGTYYTKNWLFPTSLMFVLASLGPIIYSRLKSQAENRLLAEQKSYQQNLIRISKGLSHIKEKDRLIQFVVNIIHKLMKLSHAGLYVYEDEYEVYKIAHQAGEKFDVQKITVADPLIDRLTHLQFALTVEDVEHKHNYPELVNFMALTKAGALVPLVQGGRMIGFFVLGKKSDDRVFTDDDLSVLNIISDQIGLALDNCRFLERERVRTEEEGMQLRREQIDMMFMTLAHEIDNPNMSVSGNAQAVLAELDDFKGKTLDDSAYNYFTESLGAVVRDSKRITQLIKAFEKYAKGNIEFEEVDLNELMKMFEPLLEVVRKKYFKETGAVKYQAFIEEKLPKIFGVSVTIEEIWLNFMGNAFHAVRNNPPEKGKEVAFKMYQKNSQMIRMEVTDNGYGIANEKIKSSLFNNPMTTKGSAEGTGLGLYRVRHICEMHKGRCGCESEGEGKGATFWVEIPVVG
ncbi:MAG: GAF domain-containing protein [Candidatus Omnitrophica bacterium]|nr:GAF domain-containing protein [Candidatus Omnitrophota bacterium]